MKRWIGFIGAGVLVAAIGLGVFNSIKPMKKAWAYSRTIDSLQVLQELSMSERNIKNVGDIALDSISADGSSITLPAVSTADINGGTIDGATVGASSASTGAFTTFTASGAVSLNGSVAFGTDSITLDAADPGTATATLAEHTSYIITDATGTEIDAITLPVGTIGGQQKRFVLYTDAETAGVTITPATETLTDSDTANGTSTYMADIGDSVTFEWVDTVIGWVIVSINGTIVN